MTLMVSPLSHSLPDSFPQTYPQSISGFILNHLYQQVVSQKPTVKKYILECNPLAMCVGTYEFVCIHMGFPCSSAGKESACNAGDLNLILGLGRSPGERNGYLLQYSWTSLVAQLESTCQVRETWVWSWVGKIPWRRERLPTPVFWPREFHGLYSPWGCKESDTTERLSLSLFMHT